MDSNVEILTTLPGVPGVGLSPLEQAIARVSPDMSNDDVLTIYDRIQFVCRESKRLKEAMERAMIEWMTETGSVLVVSPTVRYYVGSTKTTKCTNIPATVQALMTAANGDYERFCGTLAANAIKHGAAKRLLTQEQFGILFKTTTKAKLEGGPEKELMKADDAFA